MENPDYRGNYFSSYIGLACVKNDTGSGRQPFLYSGSATADSKHQYRGEAERMIGHRTTIDKGLLTISRFRRYGKTRTQN